VSYMKLLGAQDLAEIRKRWEKDIGSAAKDVIRVLDHAEVLLEVAKHHSDRDAAMFANLTAVQARCTALLEENRVLKSTDYGPCSVCDGSGRVRA
jgi:hypothetical protein